MSPFGLKLLCTAYKVLENIMKSTFTGETANSSENLIGIELCALFCMDR